MQKKELRNFGLIFSGFLIIVFVLLIPWLFDSTRPAWPYWFAGVIGMLALIKPILLQPLYKGWMWFGEKIGKFNTILLLGMVFYLLITPMALLMKLFNKKLIALDIKPDIETYREKSEARAASEMEDPF